MILYSIELSLIIISGICSLFTLGYLCHWLSRYS